MKQKDRDGLKSLSLTELKAELRQSRGKQFGLTFKHGSTPLSNPLEKRTVRKKVAVIKTFIREKEIADTAKKKSDING